MPDKGGGSGKTSAKLLSQMDDMQITAIKPQKFMIPEQNAPASAHLNQGMLRIVPVK